MALAYPSPNPPWAWGDACPGWPASSCPDLWCPISLQPAIRAQLKAALFSQQKDISAASWEPATSWTRQGGPSLVVAPVWETLAQPWLGPGVGDQACHRLPRLLDPQEVSSFYAYAGLSPQLCCPQLCRPQLCRPQLCCPQLCSWLWGPEPPRQATHEGQGLAKTQRESCDCQVSRRANCPT